jgi:hypothetical protein
VAGLRSPYVVDGIFPDYNIGALQVTDECLYVVTARVHNTVLDTAFAVQREDAEAIVRARGVRFGIVYDVEAVPTKVTVTRGAMTISYPLHPLSALRT